MELIFAGAAIASLAYFVIILLYNGITSFLWFWPVFVLVNFAMFFMVRFLRRRKRQKKEVWIAPFVAVFTTYGLGLATLLLLIAIIFAGGHSVERKNLDYVIVLGTDLDDNRISRSLRRRLDRALAYAEENPGTTFVLSGGRGDYDKSTQATVMYYYMIQHGVPAQNLMMEFYSHSTLEKIGFSMKMIEEDRTEKLEELDRPDSPAQDRRLIIAAEDRPLSVGILTSEFNMYRAVHMAEKFGAQDICPMATRSDELMLVHLLVREAVAIFKDRLMGNI
ncbi:ElyC/SanA/YdcF family protein [Oribacterium sp. HCP28S3_H8]|uniref:YdcF family protein n=1 Tax=Oribacterium sp. HCP28S3_H8 TaxID=3438945 RepID=UPI003F8AA38C